MARFYYYSVEELGGGEGGGGGGRTKPGPKRVEKPSAARFAHPLRGAEVLVAVRGPSPGEGGGKNLIVKIQWLVLSKNLFKVSFDFQQADAEPAADGMEVSFL